ncbi:MAG: hypothetical protein BMS9Abin36_0719 [Gammaproteobacteria bacterium]|nr:MAG: hypothetical protein BMS9Abin36_0719 [Gammaproteobacteria bacterium]
MKRLLLIVMLSVYGLVAGCAGEPVKKDEAEAPAPEPESKAEASAPEPAPPAKETYLVLQGDTLWGIAAKEQIYSDPYYWPLLYKENAAGIADADLIEVGQVLDLRRDYSEQDKSAAVHHAQYRGPWSLGEVEASDKAYLSK